MKINPLKAFTVLNTHENRDLLIELANYDYMRGLKGLEYLVVYIRGTDVTFMEYKTSKTIQGKLLSTDELKTLKLIPMEAWANYLRSI